MDKDFASLADYILINYRWIFVCLFLLPLSFIYDLMFYIRNWIIFKLTSAPKQHDKKVKHVQKQVKIKVLLLLFLFFGSFCMQVFN